MKIAVARIAGRGIPWFVCGVLALAMAMAGCATRPRIIDSIGEADKTASDQLQAGMAEIDITPPIGFRMAGYFNERFATGIHDPLKAKALVLRQGRRQVALVF